MIGRCDEVSDVELVHCDWAAGPRSFAPITAVLTTRMFDSELDDGKLRIQSTYIPFFPILADLRRLTSTCWHRE
jgi:hypothetical protein